MISSIDDSAEKALLVLLGGLLGWLATLVTNRVSGHSQFDYQFRLEKEYARYCDLWKKLFLLRRAIGSLIETLGGGRTVSHKDEVTKLFNTYQKAVRFGEPFMDTSVHDPARAIIQSCLRIINNIDSVQELQQIDDRETKKAEWKQLREDTEMKFQEIDKLFDEVSAAIKKRVTP
ncbi:MAG TPA: hypothetical protein VMJ32_05280 [Pirellulales bacterium]|nr:hypothetical protein [Pirellulales bacterium]